MWRGRFFLLLREAGDRLAEQAAVLIQASAFPWLKSESDQRRIIRGLRPRAREIAEAVDDNRGRLEAFRVATQAGANAAVRRRPQEPRSE